MDVTSVLAETSTPSSLVVEMRSFAIGAKSVSTHERAATGPVGNKEDDANSHCMLQPSAFRPLQSGNRRPSEIPNRGKFPQAAQKAQMGREGVALAQQGAGLEALRRATRRPRPDPKVTVKAAMLIRTSVGDSGTTGV